MEPEDPRSRATQDKAPGATPLRPLPRLKVLRNKYCSQEVVDRAADFLCENNRELVEDFLLEERTGFFTPSYHNAVYYILDYLNEDGNDLEIPQTDLGRMDLASELGRRLRKAYELVEVPLRGKPLADGPGEPLPPLVTLEITEGTARRGALTQEFVDKVLLSAYQTRPDLWFLLAEGYRNWMLLDPADQFRKVINEILKTEPDAPKNSWASGEIYIEAVRRIYVMCGMES